MFTDLEKALEFLQTLVSIPSYSDQEDLVASEWEKWLKQQGVKKVERYLNNIFVISENYDSEKPILMLNSHMDTVRPVKSYTRDPFKAEIKEGKLYGLGSNDAGGSGVSLALTFLSYYKRTNLPFNIMLAITASEERMGEGGMRAFLPFLKERNLYPDYALVGEPTDCKAAIAERGLVVVDATVKGESAHAARAGGVNAIYGACEDINLIRQIKWDKESEILGPVKATVTMINSGTQHNIIPDICNYVIDVRTTDAFTNEETVEILRDTVNNSELTPRSFRIRPSVLKSESVLCRAAELSGLEKIISPTTSDMALMYDIPSIKIGPGKSERSHTADEFIKLEEIQQGLETYARFLDHLVTLI
ncbi:MAG: M20/M25/M40 family metallo-hydrolase [Muribaculaceae bacterium]|nr:M20/M25/M40 family metallo-hydrolase [Muribaculaceae bacterium]